MYHPALLCTRTSRTPRYATSSSLFDDRLASSSALSERRAPTASFRDISQNHVLLAPLLRYGWAAGLRLRGGTSACVCAEGSVQGGGTRSISRTLRVCGRVLVLSFPADLPPHVFVHMRCARSWCTHQSALLCCTAAVVLLRELDRPDYGS